MAHLKPYWKGFYCQANEEELEEVKPLKFCNVGFHGQFEAEEFTESGVALVSGQTNGEKIDFRLQSQGGIKFFKGQREGDRIEGEWGNNAQQDVGRGNFRLNLVRPQKGWNGYYVQDDIEEQMKFDEMTLSENEGKFVGRGSDSSGEFVIEGEVGAGGRVTFTKQKADKKGGRGVLYWGDLVGKEVTGHWGRLEGKPRGAFRLFWLE